MDNDIVSLKIPSNPGYLQVIRLAAASLANRMGFDIDDVEDIKVLVSEVVNYVIPINDSIEILFDIGEDRLKIKVIAGKIAYEGAEDNDQLKFRRQILLSLADDIYYDDTTVTIIKNK